LGVAVAGLEAGFVPMPAFQPVDYFVSAVAVAIWIAQDREVRRVCPSISTLSIKVMVREH